MRLCFVKDSGCKERIVFAMKKFNNFYLWAANMKYHMALYTVAAVFVKSITNLIMGQYSVESLTMLQMLFVSLVFACAESFLFPQGKEWGVTGWRMVLWAVLANMLYIGAAIVFGWFPGIPVWCGIVAVAFVEIGLFAMWYALWLENKNDNRCLNCNLKEFQKN